MKPIATLNKSVKEEIKKAFDNEIHQELVRLKTQLKDQGISAPKTEALIMRFRPDSQI